MLIAMAACAGDAQPAADANVPCVPAPDSTAPTYAQLYAQYFAPSTPGHCATARCHADPDHTTWLCGGSAATCYHGMVEVGLIDPANPKASMIASTSSPLSWINSTGNMPFDATGSFPAGRDAILAWVAQCAQGN